MVKEPPILALLLILPMLTGCSIFDGSNCPDIKLQDGMCLVFEDPQTLDRPSIESVIRQSLVPIIDAMPIEEVTIRIIDQPSLAIPGIGIGGNSAGADQISLFFAPDNPQLATSIANGELSRLLAHELHHEKRERSVGYGSTLFEAMVSEGLADHFALEVFTLDLAPWSRALNEDDIELWKNEAAKTWDDAQYDHSAWFFGSGPPIPRYVGYTVGFNIVGDFLAANPGDKPSSLFGRRAAEFR